MANGLCRGQSRAIGGKSREQLTLSTTGQGRHHLEIKTMFALRSWTVEQADNNATLTIQESRDSDKMIISINEEGTVSRIELSRESWDALSRPLYDFRWTFKTDSNFPFAPRARTTLDAMCAEV